MSSTDSEIQRDELDALTSILDETAFEIHPKLTTTDATHGTLAIEVILPDQFYIEYHPSMSQIFPFSRLRSLSIDRLDQSRRVQYLPPIFLRFTLPNDYPSVSQPFFELECIWMIDEQVKISMEIIAKCHLFFIS